jgi:hypothetical protein
LRGSKILSSACCGIPTAARLKKGAEVLEKKKLNCWEVKKCGREPGGERVADLGVCPAAEEQRANGIHQGKNAGRCCWVIDGTLCKGNVQGSYVEKFCGDCQRCDFYGLVKKEEEPKFKIGLTIMKEIKNK